MNHTDTATLRRWACTLLIVAAAGTAAGRILSAELVLEPSLHKPSDRPQAKGRNWPPKRPEPMPTFGSNDRSRWATVRALVENGTFVVGKREYRWTDREVVALFAAGDGVGAAALAQAADRNWHDSGIIFEDGWQSVDKVLNPDTLEFYSSKPPLFSTLVAGLYWLLRQLFGWDLSTNAWEVVRVTLFLVNWVPLLVYLKLFTNLVERSGAGDWAKLFLVAAACFATLLTPFVITLNNHSVGTYCVLFALYPAIRIWEITAEGRPAPAYLFALAGLLAGFAACNELPALAFTAALGLVLLLRARGRTLAYFVPAAAVPLAAFLLTNYLAVGQLRPAYAEFGGPWYEYEGSHWANRGPHRTGIDMAGFHESWGAYAFHVLVGHHGWFSLTPIWLFAVAGMFGGLAAARRSGGGERPAEGLPRFVAPLTLAVSVIVIAFYLSRGDRNYGGWTNGLRWLIWLTPLWLLCMARVMDRVAASRWGRWVAYVLLGVSVLSASYYSWNPWRHPWLYRYMDWQGWIPY